MYDWVCDILCVPLYSLLVGRLGGRGRKREKYKLGRQSLDSSAVEEAWTLCQVISGIEKKCTYDKRKNN